MEPSSGLKALFGSTQTKEPLESVTNDLCWPVTQLHCEVGRGLSDHLGLSDSTIWNQGQPHLPSALTQGAGCPRQCHSCDLQPQ